MRTEFLREACRQCHPELAEKLVEDALVWDAKGHAPLTDSLALWLAPRYAIRSE